MTDQQPKLTLKSEQCLHCSNKAPMYLICEGDWKYFASPEPDPDYGELTYVLAVTHWQILVCPSCEKANIIETFTDHEADGKYLGTNESGDPIFETYQRSSVLYPNRSKNHSHVPQKVLQSYEIALRLLPIEPIAFAVFAGRTLEFLCHDKQAQGKNLEQKLKFLADRGEIPIILAEMAHSLRLFRNFGAHATDVEISREDALALRDLCDAILEYVYEAPFLLNRVKERLSEIKSNAANAK